MTDTPIYVPGVCNINTEEIARRRKIGHVGAAALMILFIVLFATSLSRYVRIILLIPAFLSATGYLQARNKFCVGYASAGQQNATEGSKAASSIKDKSAIATDKKKARVMNIQALLIAVVIVIVAVIA
jgi:hypothetical protein